MQKFVAFVKENQHALLTMFFGHALLFRFLFPFVYSPLQQIWSDPARHWYNGLVFLSNPSFVSGMDGKAYQIWIWLVIQITQQQPLMVNAFCGILCAGMAYAWYRAARELLPKTTALLFGLVVALHPSLLVMYSYFMTETLLLTVSGFATWFSLRAYRKRELPAFAVAVFFWVIAMHTRTIALPIAIGSILLLIMALRKQRIAAICIAFLFIGMTAIPAALYSHKIMNVYSPFTFSTLNKLYVYSKTRAFGLHIPENGARYEWGSPSMGTRPLEPLLDYKNHREGREPPLYFTVNKQEGFSGWTNRIAELKKNYSWQDRWLHIRDNAVFFFFGSSWPDSAKESDRIWWHANYLSRWLWAPMILAIVILYPRTRMKKPEAWIISLLLAMIGLLMLQNTGIMEGRFRKPLEPFILLSFFILWHRFYKPIGKSPWYYFSIFVVNSRMTGKICSRNLRPLKLP